MLNQFLYVLFQTHFYAGLHTLRELILKKPADLEKYVKELLDLTQHERTEVRSQAIQYIKRFYDRPDLKPVIEVCSLSADEYYKFPVLFMLRFEVYTESSTIRFLISIFCVVQCLCWN